MHRGPPCRKRGQSLFLLSTRVSLRSGAVSPAYGLGPLSSAVPRRNLRSGERSFFGYSCMSSLETRTERPIGKRAEAIPDDMAMLRAAAEVTRDLSTARPGIYWPDMLL